MIFFFYILTLLNIQLLFYGMTYLMILILTNLKTFYYLGMEMNANAMHVKKKYHQGLFNFYIIYKTWWRQFMQYFKTF
jgi:magnesium-transporting ATPase (P-type)